MAKQQKHPGPNATVVDLLAYMVQIGRLKAARDLAAKLDELEDCYAYELNIDPEA